MPGFELQEDVVPTHAAYEARVTAWVPDRATYEASPREGKRWALTGPAETPEYAATVAETLARILSDYLIAKIGPPLKRVHGRAAHLGAGP